MINLDELNVLEMPKKEIEVSVLGKKHKMTVTAFGDDISIQMSDIKDNRPDDGELRIRRLLITECVDGMTERAADMLLKKDGKAVSDILAAILDLTDEFDKERNAMRKNAEKNSGTEAAGNTRG